MYPLREIESELTLFDCLSPYHRLLLQTELVRESQLIYMRCECEGLRLRSTSGEITFAIVHTHIHTLFKNSMWTIQGKPINNVSTDMTLFHSAFQFHVKKCQKRDIKLLGFFMFYA